jgi:CheY-like chemotaxis protein/HPt (histidine-containing phosphotransfer) domain-containing protein
MGGEIWAESQVGRGSTFRFRLTCEVVDVAEAASNRSGASPSEAGRLLRGRRTLIVDDNPTNRQILEEMLGTWGCFTESASGGPTALEMLRAAANRGDPFELVILDVQMPELDGFAVEREIHRQRHYGSPAVVFLSSLSNPIDAPDQAASSGSAYLSKPVKQSVLLDTLLALFADDRASAGTSVPTPSTAAGPRPNRRRYRARILLVEDNPVNRKVAAGILRQCNHDVTTADNGQAALELLKERSFDLILMDLQMPEMDGFEATKRIRANAQWRRLPVIAMTAHAMKGDRERCFEAGMDDYLTKPVKAEELQQMADKWLPAATASAPVKAARTAGEATAPSTEPDGHAERPLDVPRALELLGDDRELFDDALAMFLENIPRNLGEIRAAISAANAPKLRLLAHSLKGAASNICAEPTRQAAQKLEQAGQREALQTADSMFEELQGHLDRLQQYAASLREEQ